MTAGETLFSVVARRRKYPGPKAREIRLAAKVTVKEIAEMIGVPPTHIRSWEQGSNPQNRALMDRYLTIVEGLEKAIQADCEVAS